MRKVKKVQPVSPVAPYLGGKSRLAKTIIGHIDRIDHRTYCEPFVGMGGVFLRRTRKARAEVINDINCEVANLFRILQYHHAPFLDMIRWQIGSRNEFARMMEAAPGTLTDLQRAARFLYLQRLGFGGKVTGRVFGVDVQNSGRFNVERLAPALEALHRRLAGVTIEQLDYRDCLRRYDRPATLFYLDPPYFGHENDYGRDVFDPAEFERMAECLAALKGCFLLSLNDHAEVRRLFRGFHIRSVTTTYSIAKTAPSKRKEVLISNVRLDA